MKKLLLSCLISCVFSLACCEHAEAQWTYSRFTGKNINGVGGNGSNIYAGIDYCPMYVSTDTCQTWNTLAVANGLPASYYLYTFKDRGTDMFAGLSTGLYLSKDT